MKIHEASALVAESIIPRLNRKIISFMATLGGKFRDNLTENEMNKLRERRDIFSCLRKPGSLGMNSATMEVVSRQSVDRLPWRYMIHEFGHLLASTVHPDKANDSDFIAWEKRVAEIVGGPMDAWHMRADVFMAAGSWINCGPGLEMPTKEAFDKYYKQQHAFAKHCRLIENDQPKAIRQPGNLDAMPDIRQAA